MTPAGPLGAATPVAGGLPAADGTAPAAGAGQDFLALVLQMLGQAPSDPAAPAAPDATTDPAAEPPAGGGSATVLDTKKVAGTPLPGQETSDEDEATDQPPSGAGDPAILAALPLTLLQAVVAARTPAASAATNPAPDTTPGVDAAPANDVSSAPSTSPDGTPPTTDPATSAAPSAPAPPTAPAAGSITPMVAPTTVTAVPAQVGPAAPAPAPVTHQVFDEIVRVAGTGAGPRRVTVRLQPEALGEVRVVLSVRDGSLRVSLAAGGAAHHTLLAGAPELQRLLEAAGSPDARIVVRDLPPGVPTTASSASSTPVPGSGQGTAPDPGTGFGAGQAGSGQTPERRTPSHGGSTAKDGIHDPADPPRRTESVTRTRTAGVDVTM